MLMELELVGFEPSDAGIRDYYGKVVYALCYPKTSQNSKGGACIWIHYCQDDFLYGNTPVPAGWYVETEPGWMDKDLSTFGTITLLPCADVDEVADTTMRVARRILDDPSGGPK